MAKGFDLVEQQAQATQEARERFAQSLKPELRVNAKNPGPYTIRILEQGQDVNSYPVHEYKVPAPSVRGGFAYVGVTAQAVGVASLKAWDPTRYSRLVHPGDAFSYDIYSQAIQAVRRPGKGLKWCALAMRHNVLRFCTKLVNTFQENRLLFQLTPA